MHLRLLKPVHDKQEQEHENGQEHEQEQEEGLQEQEHEHKQDPPKVEVRLSGNTKSTFEWLSITGLGLGFRF